MAKYMVRESYIRVVGVTWMPAVTAAYQYNLQPYDIENLRNAAGDMDREAVANWLATHTGDFQSITDFSASIEDPNTDETIEIPWAEEENEYTFQDCMYPSDVVEV